MNEPDVDEPDANADHREESTMEDVDKARREDRLLDEAVREAAMLNRYRTTAFNPCTHCEEPVPIHMLGAMIRWIEHAIPADSFMQAVIENNLKAAVQNADNDNIHLIPLYVSWLYSNAPANCWGSLRNTECWPTILAHYKTPPPEIEDEPQTLGDA